MNKFNFRLLNIWIFFGESRGFQGGGGQKKGLVVANRG